MFSEQTAPIGTYDTPMDSEFHVDGCMKPKNGPRALTGGSLVIYKGPWCDNSPKSNLL